VCTGQNNIEITNFFMANNKPTVINATKSADIWEEFTKLENM
jgi:hypothetical protein